MPPSGTNLQRFLDRLTSRSLLSAEEQRAILDLPAIATHAHGNQDLVGLDEVVDHASLIVEGLVARFDQNARGERQITAFHIPGDMANLHSVVQPRATSALQALSPATILKVPHRALRTIAGRYPAVAEALWRDCVVDAGILSQWVLNVGRRDARSRMAHLMCETAVRSKARDGGKSVTFAFPATQFHLADATGLTPVHVNRTLKGLERDGVMNFSNRTVKIARWDELTLIGEFDATYLQIDMKPEERFRMMEMS